MKAFVKCLASFKAQTRTLRIYGISIALTTMAMVFPILLFITSAVGTVEGGSCRRDDQSLLQFARGIEICLKKEQWTVNRMVGG